MTEPTFLSEDALAELIRLELPDAQVKVLEFSGRGDHFRMEVTSSAFVGKSLIQQHQMVYAALGDRIDSGVVHALGLTTRTP